jgi:hypothetical protein
MHSSNIARRQHPRLRTLPAILVHQPSLPPTAMTFIGACAVVLGRQIALQFDIAKLRTARLVRRPLLQYRRGLIAGNFGVQKTDRSKGRYEKAMY